MTRPFSLSLLFLLFIVPIAKAQHVNPVFKFSEVSHGLYSSQTVAKETMAESPSGTHTVVEKQILLKQTEKIPAKIGSEFGTEYKLTGNNADTVILEIEWVYPHEIIDKQKNTSFKSIRYPIQIPANAANASTYSLEDDFEVVKGDWLLNIYSDNKIIYSKRFQVN